MKRRVGLPALPVIALLAVVLGAMAAGAFAENIDPANDNSRFAWGENVGWINAAPNGTSGPGVVVGHTALYGYMWSENAGWISLSCNNTATCSPVNYGVGIFGVGDLLGYAWSENAGWISFSCGNTGTCGTVDYGVHINASTGVFSGQAWGENIGWITFSATSPVAYQVRTSWPGKSAGDSDGDGCPDLKEQQTAIGSQLTGGRRDYLNPWDYFNPTHDGVNRADDILYVVRHYHHDRYLPSPPNPPNTPNPQYDPATDRSYIGPNPWNLGPPDGFVTAIDILEIVRQYHHDCS